MRILTRLYTAASLAEAARYAQALPNSPACGRVCLMQQASGEWTVCLYCS